MNARLPLYQIIAQTLRRRILTGHYTPGEKIPPIRQVAREFHCNKLTAQKAYNQLKRERLIENRVGSGSYVCYPEKIHSSPGFFDFRTDYLHGSFFPYEKAQAICNMLFGDEKAHALASTPVEGDPELLQVLSQHYHLPMGRMLMISGAQQGLDLVSKVFAAKISESMLFEDPTYPGAISLFKARHFISLGQDGPDLDQLDRRLSRSVRLFYSMPAVHNPTGTAYSAAKREALAARARVHPFYIIEDDYLGELAAPAPRFVDICPERTIFIKSFAQTTVAGIRLGFMVVPEDLYVRFVYAKFSSDITSSGLLQKLLREFIKQGHYGAHLDKVRKTAVQRRRMLGSLLGKYPRLKVSPNQSGYSLWVKAAVEPTATQVPWCRGEEFSFSAKFRSCFKIAFMHMDDATFGRGLVFLESLLERGAPGGFSQ